MQELKLFRFFNYTAAGPIPFSKAAKKKKKEEEEKQTNLISAHI